MLNIEQSMNLIRRCISHLRWRRFIPNDLWTLTGGMSLI